MLLNVFIAALSSYKYQITITVMFDFKQIGKFV